MNVRFFGIQKTPGIQYSHILIGRARKRKKKPRPQNLTRIMAYLAERTESIFHTFSMFQDILSPLQFSSHLDNILYQKIQQNC